MNKELIFLRSFALFTVLGISICFISFTGIGNTKFTEIDVERINIVEPDGTTKMIITNMDRFPQGETIINNRKVNPDRKKRSGMLFFNEDGIECGGFIYDGKKNEQGHSSGLSLTYDQYDGDQVMQLLTTDYGKGEERMVSSSLVFNDRPKKETQDSLLIISQELNSLYKSDPEKYKTKLREYKQAEVWGSTPRIMLGKTRSLNNGLFLFDDNGNPKAMFYVDKNNNAKLDFYDNSGNVIASFPKDN